MIIWIGCPFDELLARVVLTDCSFEGLLASPALFFYSMGVNIFLCVCGNTLLKSRRKAVGIYDFNIQIVLL